MRRFMISAALAAAFLLVLGSGAAYAQATFKISFKFEVGDKSFPPGDYRIAQKEDAKISLLRVATGDEISIGILKKLSEPEAAVEAPQIIFDMVANFEPSYTEYVTEYLLAEVWLTGEEGFLVLDGERAEYTKDVKGTAIKK
jgi:hypothetical protein